MMPAADPALLYDSLSRMHGHEAMAHQYFFWMKGSSEVSIRLSDSLMRFLVAPSSFRACPQHRHSGLLLDAASPVGMQLEHVCEAEQHQALLRLALELAPGQ